MYNKTNNNNKNADNKQYYAESQFQSRKQLLELELYNFFHSTRI